MQTAHSAALSFSVPGKSNFLPTRWLKEKIYGKLNMILKSYDDFTLYKTAYETGTKLFSWYTTEDREEYN